ncbi:MAG: hypothetical protein K2H18_03135 [Muribaculaceae bacterium]|nr:hypothetical protein [Muribaculaceae bacterium]
MNKFFKFFYAFVICVITLSFAGCSDKDEPSDPNMPESGSWKISEYEDLSVRFANVSCDREHWAFWENEFKKEIAKRKIVINKKTPVEDGWYILSRDDERDKIGYLHDLEKIEPENVEGKTMTASYYLKQYLSVQSDDDYVIFRATVKCTRK